MKYYHLIAELHSPMLVQENRQSNAPRGLPYLPGSSLRGAIAGHYLRNGGNPDDEEFINIFLEKPIIFPDLLPTNRPDQLAFPLPMTACSCKRTPGFIMDGHGIGDSLAALVASEIGDKPSTKNFDCKTCQQEMKPYEGFWNGNTDSPEKSEPVLIYQRHTGIDRHTGTVASSIFYITQGLAECRKGADDKYHTQYLIGGMYLTDSQFETLSDWITETLFAGADRTRGMGEMSLSLEESVAPEFDVEGWSKNFAKLTRKPIPSGLYFSIGLNSHTIMVDQFLRPSPEIMLDFPNITLVTRIIRQHTVRGWQSSWRLPKPEDKAIGMGSVYLFRYNGGDKNGLMDYLKQLSVEGIGLRCAEGFGRIRVCDPLHIQEVI